ncbi:CaiB/BaiF CoA transferase family protein [Pseudarthrobacter sulfonivorans]|uniref:CaiB/BaiF CoA transferase family protein n=1 Tax=Pseudarthrobacter sulfonivorans TaxID=121292 RepID=UPI0027823702|nr:CoA transferase [Pseudarthrobacter sulfonivorans]MDQ0000628.1 crotonobetainyl-CoA:carnitine CoA-transferase CaiB-like acyl-CoA transferase [Pseudarthrobacter sulfonivorans]
MTLQSSAAPPTPKAPQDSRPIRRDAFGRDVSGPLAGIVVADFSRVLAGPYCTMLLADMGATVLKVESPSGDETREWKPPVYEGQSTYYLSINRNKRSIALDFDNPDDVETARHIAVSADVFIENFKPGGLDRFGLDYASIAERNPAVIYASITGFGSSGGATLPGYDLLVQAMSGLMSLTGDPQFPAYRSGVAVFDVITGLHTAIGVLSALHERSQSGRGQRIEVNLMSSALSGMVNQTAGFLLSGNVPTRMGNEHPSIYPYEPLPTADGEIILAIGNDRQFRTLCAVLGAHELAVDPRFGTPPDRSHNRAALRPLLVELLAIKPASAWFDIFTEARLPCAPINDVRGGIEFAERLGLAPVVEVGTGEDAIPGVRNPISFSATPASYDLVPPGIDADRGDILQWLQASPER